MRERTRGFAIATRDLLAKSDALEQGIEELRAITSLISDSVVLTDLLVDRGLSARMRKSVLDELLEARVDARVLRLVDYTIDTEFAGDVPENVALLVAVLQTSYVLGDGIEIATGARARGYAHAIMQDLDRAGLSQLMDELLAMVQILENEPSLRSVLSGFGGNPAQRVAIAEDLLSEKVSPAALLVLRAAVAVTSPRSLIEALERVLHDCSDIMESQVARVTLARAASDVYRARIVSSLQQRSRRELVVEWQVDPTLIGGMVAVVGDRVYDVSVARELQRAQQVLAGR